MQKTVGTNLGGGPDRLTINHRGFDGLEGGGRMLESRLSPQFPHVGHLAGSKSSARLNSKCSSTSRNSSERREFHIDWT